MRCFAILLRILIFLAGWHFFPSAFAFFVLICIVIHLAVWVATHSGYAQWSWNSQRITNFMKFHYLFLTHRPYAIGRAIRSLHSQCGACVFDYYLIFRSFRTFCFHFLSAFFLFRFQSNAQMQWKSVLFKQAIMVELRSSRYFHKHGFFKQIHLKLSS